MTKQEVLSRMCAAGVVAVIRAPSAQSLADIAEALLAGGVPSVEVTMTTPGAIAAIEMLAKRFGDQALLGVGTVLDAQTARDAIKAGARFVVSPTFNSEIVSATLEASQISIPGAYTPSEILRASLAGADVVKVFPSTTLGPQYFKDILAPLPNLKLTPTGGVDLNNTGQWIKAGAVCVGVGSALVSKEAVNNKDWTSITNTARKFIEVVKAARAA
jgi:2-dehydro-3-deoxyphosphogluconate aldolase / (4S)-4-hydroxy-2-oxoglutarate aldolase